MFLIEPCCTQKHLLELRHKLGGNGACFFHGHGDLSLAEILPVLLTRYSEVELMMVLPRVPDAAAEVIRHVMDREWTTANGKGKVFNIKRLDLIADMRKAKSPTASAWVKENPWEGRLFIRNIQQGDTAILLPDIGMTGPINLQYGGHFIALATRSAKTSASLKAEYEKL